MHQFVTVSFHEKSNADKRVAEQKKESIFDRFIEKNA